MSEPVLDAGTPPTGESVHMPAPSALPLINAAALAFAIVCITVSWVLVAVGLIVSTIMLLIFGLTFLAAAIYTA